MPLDPPRSESTRARQGAQLDTWPFWAPSDEAAVEAALDLAEVGPGDHLVDLGCGDGRVLLAAARRGAVVSGIEADVDLAAEARERLIGAGVPGDVTGADLFDPATTLEADVFFTYLAPATLQRLLPALAVRRGARLVTVDFDVPGLVPTKRADPARLYRLPGRRRPVGAVGWPSVGTLVSTVPDCQSLSCLELVHPGGNTTVGLSRSLASAATVLAGAASLTHRAHLALDVRWEPMASGTVVGGSVRCTGVVDHPLFVVVTDEEEGMWELTDEGVGALRSALRRRVRPTSLAELLDAASG